MADFQSCYFPILDGNLDSGTIWHSISVPSHDVMDLHSKSTQLDVSPLSYLQMAWAMVLRSYIGSSSLNFGCVSLEKVTDSNAGSGDSDEFVHVTCCHVELDEEYTVLESLKAMPGGGSAGFVSKRAGSLAKPIEDGLAMPSSFNTALLYQISESEYSELAVESSIATATQKIPKYDIVVEAMVYKDAVSVTLHYRQSILSAQSAGNVASTLGKSMFVCMESPHLQVQTLNLLSHHDWEQIQRWNSPTPRKIDACVHEIILGHAQNDPNSPAVCSWDGNITFGELENLSSRVAHHLRVMGVKSEVLVPVCFEKSMWAIVAMVSIMRAGGAFVPLDPSHPNNRLGSIVKKCGARILVTSSKCAPLFRGWMECVVEISSPVVESLKPPLDLSPPDIQPHNAAFVLFTSGSTGDPKGIVQEHASVCTSSLAHGKALHLNSQSRVLQYAAYTFDVSMMDIHTTLMFGGCVCVPSEHDRMNGIAPVVKAMQVNWAHLTPSFASLFMPQDLPSLKTLSLGGEAVNREIVARWAEKVRLLNCYGPAECAACAIGPLTLDESRIISIGKAFGCGLCWIVDPLDHNKLLPIGAVGELLVEGPTLARGYLGDFEKTVAAFVDTPTWLQELAAGQSRRLYKTGDLVRYQADGTMVYVGRKDLQLKVRGQRVELGEIEHHLSMHAAVALALVSYPKTGIFSKSLVGVIQLHQTYLPSSSTSINIRVVSEVRLKAIDFDASSLSTYLKKSLPSYMVPNFWITVEKIPLSVSAKVDRKAVGAWLQALDCDPLSAAHLNLGLDKARAISNHETVALAISTEVADLIARGNIHISTALRGRNVILRDVGLDSIQVISLSMFVKQKFGVKVDVGFLTHADMSIQGVADCVQRLLAGVQENSVHPPTDVMREFYMFQRLVEQSFKRPETFSNVFVTGATGYLGTHILFSLLAQPNIGKVIVHVRATSVEHGMQRIIHSATLARWWSDSILERLEVWQGDLTQPRIGLKRQQWERLAGIGPKSERVDAIIHNGAAVIWNADFQTLKAANVHATVELLSATIESPSILKFIYISGGQHLNPLEDNEQEIADEVTSSTGYAQTKFVSELLVKRLSQRRTQDPQRFSIVKPGFIIGSAQDGIASIDDFLWRLVASCIDIKGYNATEADGWLFISDITQVAHTVVNSFNCSADDGLTVKILNGLTVGQFWEVLTQECGFELRPMDQESWLEAMGRDIEQKREAHHLWPLIDTFEKDQGRLGSARMPSERSAMRTAEVKCAIKKNIEYLRLIGFLPTADGVRAESERNLADLSFTRSRPRPILDATG
ncbi:hypothetical protein MMC22_001896 [Lobaria immixta]|nr:hypothetical protein [Lobaria immixta]